MKNTLKFLLILSLVAFATACGGGDDEPDLTPEEQRLVDLAGTESGVTWATTSVTFDGAPSEFFSDLTITFRATATSKTYTSTNGTPLFNASGTWDFDGTNINALVFDGDGGNVYTVSVNASATPPTLTMTVNYTASGGVAAGVNGANGTYVFNMAQQ